MANTPVLVTSVDQWVDAIVSLPRPNPFDTCCVVVPNERVAHTLRRRLTERRLTSALAGTLFVPLHELARRILANAGEKLEPNDVDLTPALVGRALAHVPLEKLSGEVLRGLPGWDDAIASTVRELEDACVGVEALLASEHPQVRDVGRLYGLIAQDRERVSSASLLRRAAELLTNRPKLHRDATLVVATGFESGAELLLLRSIPDAVWGVTPSKPLTAHHQEKIRSRYERAIANALSTSPALEPGDALQTLKRCLFSVPSKELVQDDSVRLVTYAGVHEEVDAAVSWVVQQIVELGIPTHEIALLSPTPDSYAPLIASRLRAMDWPEDAQVAFSEQGLPVIDRSDGARLLAVLRALRSGLAREQVATLLPWLRARSEDSKVAGLSRAWTLLNEVAFVGGDKVHLKDGLEWTDAWANACSRLAKPDTSSGGLEQERAKFAASSQRDLLALHDAIAALTELLRGVVDNSPLSALWERFADFCAEHLRLPSAQPPVLALIASEVSRFEAYGSLSFAGVQALELLERLVVERNTRTERFGEPAVYVGSVSGARGLRFRAVRILGLSEGSVPSNVREDAVLPDDARASLSSALPTSKTRALRQLSSFYQAISSATERLVLSAPRVGAEGSVRQPAAVLIDVLRALGAPADNLGRSFDHHAATTRQAERAARYALPVAPTARMERTYESNVAIVVSVAALRAITHRTAPGAQDGLLKALISANQLPGITHERPASATKLGTLLSCPHRHLLENVLGYRDATGPASGHSLPANTFGSVLHGVAEAFWRQHGEALGLRRGQLSEHRLALHQLARERFGRFRESYPFASNAAAEAELEGLLQQLDKLLDYDWHDGVARPFIDVERGFGYDEPCAVETSAGPIYVRGNIDRADLDGDTLLLRDLKTGKSKPRRAGRAPEAYVDLQLGLYALVATKMAAQWGTPNKVGVAYVYLKSGDIERRWDGTDYETLRKATDGWLASAIDILNEGSFVRSPNENDCTFCSHKPTCRTEKKRTMEVLRDTRVPRRLLQLKEVE